MVGIQSLLFVGVFYWLPVATVFVHRRLKSVGSKVTLYLALILTIFVPKGKWTAFAESTLWTTLFEYFNLKVLSSRDYSPTINMNQNSNTIYSVFPHGIVPYSLGLLQYGPLGAFFNHPRITTASIVEYIPLFSHVLNFGGSVPANKESITSVLRGEYDRISDTHSNVAIAPGGIAEMFLADDCDPHVEKIMLNDRKGFIRLALQNGSQIVPMFCFGASHLFKKLAGASIFEYLSRRLRASILLFAGQWGLPIPLDNVPLSYALGEGVYCPRIEEPDQFDIDWYHNIFKLHLQRAFEDNKREAGYFKSRLEIH
jgi:hypothetical protein